MSDDYTPTDEIWEPTDVSMRESYLYAQLHVRGHNTNEIGTDLTVSLSKSYERWVATRTAATRIAALEEAAGIADRSRPEIGSHINGSPYRSGKYDAAVLVAVAIRAAKDGAR